MESCSNQKFSKKLKYIFYLRFFKVAIALMTALNTLGILSTSFTWNAFPSVLKEFPHMLSTLIHALFHSFDVFTIILQCRKQKKKEKPLNEQVYANFLLKVYTQLKSEDYIHLSQIFLTFNQSQNSLSQASQDHHFILRM